MKGVSEDETRLRLCYEFIIFHGEQITMKMLFVVYSREADEDVVSAFKRSGMRGYTKMQEVYGEGQETEPKLGTHIWPGMNNVLFVVIEDDDVKWTLDLIRQMKKDHPRAGLKGFLLPLEDCV